MFSNVVMARTYSSAVVSLLCKVFRNYRILCFQYTRECSISSLIILHIAISKVQFATDLHSSETSGLG